MSDARARPYDAVVVGSGPNGLAAAVTLARRAPVGLSVLLMEGEDSIGGGARSAESTLPGFVHDVCSAVHPLAVASPFFRSLPLAGHGLSWIHPPAPLAHPLDGGTAAVLERSVQATGATLGPDARAYGRLMTPLVGTTDDLIHDLLGPLKLPRHPLALARFGALAMLPAASLARVLFRGEHARALFAGIAAHAIQPLERPLTGAFGLLLGMLGHAYGWPVPRGGSGRIADALASYFRALGGEIVTRWPVRSLDDLPPAPLVLFDVTPRQLLAIAGGCFPPRYRRQLAGYRYGAGAFKVDWALDGPIPWAAPACARAGTVHLGGTLEEIAAAERAVGQGEHPQRPFVLLAQQSLFDNTRAPQGKHTVWAYCHVPNGSGFDMTDRIERQIERFAPGFRERILAREARGPAEMERHNANYVGGDISGGVQDIRQLFTRPVLRAVPYSTPAEGVYLCSSSTPPGGGVHGMCGFSAAQAALRSWRG